MSTAFGTVLPRIERELVESERKKKPNVERHFSDVRFVVDTSYAGSM